MTYNGHLARIELFPRRNELRIEVWGVEPRTFLVILKDTLDLILARFEGLQIRREVPCICHQIMEGATGPCPEVYDYEKQLIKRLNHKVETIGDIYKQIDKQVELLQKIIEDVSDLYEKDLMNMTEEERSLVSGRERSSSAALRVLHSFLKEADPREYWDGLRRVITEDGNIFWLCEEHARPYKVQPLQIQ